MKQFDNIDEFDDNGRATSSIDFKKYIDLALRNWKKILLWAFCGLVFGIIIGFSTPKTFASTAVVAPELATRSTLSSGLNSLASLAGVNMNNLAITDAMHPDLYPVVIKSRDFYLDMFDLPVSFTNADTLVCTDLYDYMANYNKSPWYGVILGLPQIAIGAVKGLFAKEDEFDDAEGHAVIDTLRLTRQQEGVVKALSKSVSVSVERKSYVITITATMQDRIIAAQVANAVVDNLKDFVVNYRMEKSLESIAYLEEMREQTHQEYIEAQNKYARYMDANRGEQTSSAKVKLQLLQNEAQLAYQIYNSTAQSLLAAKVKVKQEAPVLVVIQKGMAPQNGKPSKVKLGLLWGILAGVVCIGILWWKKE